MHKKSNPNTRLSMVALTLCGLVLGACGDDAPTKPAAPPKAVDPPAVVESVPDAPPLPKAEPAKVAPADPAPAPITDDSGDNSMNKAVDTVEKVANKLGVEITDENKATLEKLADTVGDEATQEKIREAAGKLGVGTDGAGLDTVKDQLGKKLGLGGDEPDEVDPEKSIGDAAGRLTGKTAEKTGVDPKLAGLSGDQLRARRKAEITAQKTTYETELAAVRTKIAERKKVKPGRAAALDARLAEREKELLANHETKLAEIRQRFKVAIAGAK